MVSIKEIRQLADRIAKEFNPEKIILFGSCVGGTSTPDSDVDLLVVLPFEGKPFWKSLEIMNRVDAPFPLDLLVRRPEEMRKRYEGGDPVIRDALDHGEVLYERGA